MKRAIVLQHAPAEGPGRIRPALERRGFQVEVRELHAGAAPPAALAAGELLVVMGGPMGVGDLGDPRYPFLGAEAGLLRRVIAAGQPALGICLGAQLLAHAAGAGVRPNLDGDRIVREVGWAPVEFTAPGEPCLAGLPASEAMLHWHGDTFDLPAGAVHLATTPLCRNQGFRLGRQVGLQFHCEVDAEIVATWVREDADYVLTANGPGGAARILADTARILPAQHRTADRLIDNVIGAITA